MWEFRAMSKLLLAAGCLALLCGGCQSSGSPRPPLRGCGCYVPFLDNLYTKERAKASARRSFYHYQRQSGHRLSADFQAGFCQAYCDLALGGNGKTPPLPPPCYWRAQYRTPAGHACVQQWFEGYAAGAIQAENDGVRTYNTIPLAPGTALGPYGPGNAPYGPPLQPGGPPGYGPS
jgi:hypothetical protein